MLADAFRDAKLIGNDETLRLVERAGRVGDGWVDLPATRKAADVINIGTRWPPRWPWTKSN